LNSRVWFTFGIILLLGGVARRTLAIATRGLTDEQRQKIERRLLVGQYLNFSPLAIIALSMLLSSTAFLLTGVACAAGVLAYSIVDGSRSALSVRYHKAMILCAIIQLLGTTLVALLLLQPTTLTR